MRPLELDFQRPRRPSRAVQALLLVIAIAFAADVAWNYTQTREASNELRERLARAAARPSADPALIKVASQPVSDDEIALARETIRRLSTPWDALFKGLESARISSVAIVSVAPDPAERTVSIEGEAKNYLAALSFVANLREQRVLRRVYLAHHETGTDPQRPTRFTVTASWDPRP
ncbi:MAG: PilN domain-containing protein [Betaproteobacteria bacterium]|nr:PilN domain-containing protein [Betaproteobacteria bacterium]MDH5222738.1 PilN domain-containing protein [Betaproteobacteria bacterium]MDH5352588.1 PilN domain-containing protein [Betaproteobacteria bacterium]